LPIKKLPAKKHIAFVTDVFPYSKKFYFP
jgi:hypothetical protein